MSDIARKWAKQLFGEINKYVSVDITHVKTIKLFHMHDSIDNFYHKLFIIIEDTPINGNVLLLQL